MRRECTDSRHLDGPSTFPQMQAYEQSRSCRVAGMINESEEEEERKAEVEEAGGEAMTVEELKNC